VHQMTKRPRRRSRSRDRDSNPIVRSSDDQPAEELNDVLRKHRATLQGGGLLTAPFSGRWTRRLAVDLRKSTCGLCGRSTDEIDFFIVSPLCLHGACNRVTLASRMPARPGHTVRRGPTAQRAWVCLSLPLPSTSIQVTKRTKRTTPTPTPIPTSATPIDGMIWHVPLALPRWRAMPSLDLPSNRCSAGVGQRDSRDGST
jgi:hypothetical protein